MLNSHIWLVATILNSTTLQKAEGRQGGDLHPLLPAFRGADSGGLSQRLGVSKSVWGMGYPLGQREPGQTQGNVHSMEKGENMGLLGRVGKTSTRADLALCFPRTPGKPLPRTTPMALSLEERGIMVHL